MVSSTKSIVALAFFLTQLVPSMATAIEPLPRSESGIIPALLRSTSPEHKRSLVARGTCKIGYLACDDGFGCCPVGQYCGTWGGVPGCCPIGKTCIANDNPCIYEGDVLCPGETFCCPEGDTCSRDSLGNAKCSYIPGGGVASSKSSTRLTSATSYTPVSASATFISSVTLNTATNAPITAAGSTSSPTGATVLGDQTSSSSSSSATGLTNPLGATQGGGALANTVAGTSVALMLASIVAMLVVA